MTTWFRTVIGCHPGTRAWPWPAMSLQVAAWERPWGGWAGVPGEQSKGNLELWGVGRSKGPF